MGARTYVKKPVEVQAFQWDGTNDGAAEILTWSEGQVTGCEDPGFLEVQTLEGDMHVSPEDYVIRGIQGEFYPCKPDIFEATYNLKPMLDTIVSWSGRRHYRAPGQREALCGNYGSAPNGDGQVVRGHKEGRQASTLPLCGSCKKSAETRGLL